jgi:elongation factor P
MKIRATEIRKGQILRYQNKMVKVTSHKHITPGKGNSGVAVTMKDLDKGTNLNNRFRSGDQIEKLNVDELKMEYLYQEGDQYIFMNTENYEQIHISHEAVEDSIKYIAPNSSVSISFVEEKPVAITLPGKVTLKVEETDPPVKGSAGSNLTKDAKLESGFLVKVPTFIAAGDSVVVDTDSGDYVSRA